MATSRPRPDLATGKARAGDDTLADDLQRVGERDIAALNRVFYATYGRLLGICMRITRDKDTAEDVLQEVYIKVWNRAAGYDRSISTPMAWLGRMARNSAIDWYRAHVRRITEVLPHDNILPDPSKPVDQELIDQEDEKRAFALVDQLRDDQRSAIRDIYLGGLTYAELAERERVPLGTIKSRIHRTLTQLEQKWRSD